MMNGIRRRRRRPNKSRVLAVAFVLLLCFGALVILAAIQVVGSVGFATSARASLLRAKTAVNAGRFDQARTSLASAATSAGRAHTRLNSPAPKLLGYVPLVGRPVRSAQLLTRSTIEASAGAREALAVFPDRSPWSGATLDIASLREMRNAARRADFRLSEAVRLAHEAPAWPLPAALADVRRELVRELDQQASTANTARRLLDVLPDIVGANGPRRYFVVFQNPTELRGTGGLWGNHAFLDANGGRLELGSYGRPQRDLAPYAVTRGPDWYEARYGALGGSRDWRQMSMAPDFPTVASIAEANLDAAPGQGPVDGVIAVDPVGLRALLRLTGPIRVAGWPTRIDAGNVVQVTLHDAYRVFQEDQKRIDFLTDVAQATWARLRQTPIPVRPHALRDLGDAVASRRFLFHLTRVKEQRAIATAGADGALDGDNTFALVSQNTAPSKMDYWLERRLHLTFRLREDGSAFVAATVVMRNGGSGEGEPPYITGPLDDPLFKPAWQQQFVSLYVPSRSSDRSRDGDVPVGAEEEPGFATASTYLNIAPLSEEELRTHFVVRSLWDPKRGTLQLKFRRQPTLHPDQLRIQIAAPRGWNLANTSDETLPARRADIRVNADRDILMTFKLSRN